MSHTAPSRFNPQVLLLLKIATLLGVAVTTLGVVYSLGNRPSSTSPTSSTSPVTQTNHQLAGQYPFQVGTPAVGDQAPALKLPAADSTTFDLAAMKGKTTLLFFQEGIACPACWDQISDIEKHFDQFQALGIDQMVSISTDPLDVLKQKAAFEGYKTPLLTDLDMSVSHAYTTNKYGMMGDHMNGHSFILVGPDGKILWRADYGGAPYYFMYIPVPNLIADIEHGLPSN
ncbi:MAG TPA: peroxiredoxin family protein [Leptolyngbyaceae cyanobacterium]